MLSATELLSRLIAVPSVNPLLPGATEQDDERELAGYVAGYLRSAGVGVELQEVKDGRCNVIGHLERRGGADAEVVLLTAHMDTYPANGPRSGFTPLREGSALYGRGSADAKGPLAAMLTAFLAAARAPSRREAYLAATVDEECLLLGARRLGAHGMRPSLAVTGEPTSLVPVVAQKGIVRGSFRVHGPKSHAAYPAAVTAVTSAMELVDAVRRLNAAYAAEPPHPRLGPPTVTVTRVESDGGMNLVAREVIVWFDARFLPGAGGEEFAAAMEARLRGLVPGTVDFAPAALAFVSPPNESRLDTPLISEFFAAVKSETGSCDPESFSYGSEAGVLAEFSGTSLVFGPGDARYSHGETEAIDVGELDTATAVFRRILTGDPQNEFL